MKTPSNTAVVKEVCLKDIIEGIQVRVNPICEKTVNNYLELKKEGADFPPIDLFSETGAPPWIRANGAHREEMHKRAGLETIKAIIHIGNKIDALTFATQANVEYGLHLTNKDKWLAANLLLSNPEIYPAWSERKIAKHLRVSHTFIQNVLKKTTTSESGNIATPFDPNKKKAAPPQLANNAVIPKRDIHVRVERTAKFNYSDSQHDIVKSEKHECPVQTEPFEPPVYFRDVIPLEELSSYEDVWEALACQIEATSNYIDSFLKSDDISLLSSYAIKKLHTVSKELLLDATALELKLSLTSLSSKEKV